MKWVMIVLALSLLLVGCGGKAAQTVQQVKQATTVADKAAKAAAVVEKMPPDATWIVEPKCGKYLNDDARAALKRIHGRPLQIVERFKQSTGVRSGCSFLIPDKDRPYCEDDATYAQIKQQLLDGQPRCARSLMKMDFNCVNTGGDTHAETIDSIVGWQGKTILPNVGDNAVISAKNGIIHMAKRGCYIIIDVGNGAFHYEQWNADQVQAAEDALIAIAKLVDSNFQGQGGPATGGGLA